MSYTYDWGTHGAKGREQQRLGTSGATHQSEHTIGYAVLAQGAGLPRGKSTHAREIENYAPAYQETYGAHRAHIGTGTHSTPDASGFTSASYRDAQRAAIESGHVSTAVQLNQLGYAFDSGFRGAYGSSNGQKATDSYNSMVGHMHGVTYASPTGDVSVPVDAHQRAEMHLARLVAAGHGAGPGGYPSPAQEAHVRGLYGL